MPFARQTLTDLRAQVAQDIAAEIPGAALLRFSNLRIMGNVQAGLANQHFGYIDWISKQAVPFTATQEFLQGWAALKGVVRKGAVAWGGTVTFSGAVNAPLPSGTPLTRADGAQFTTTADGVVGSSGTVTVAAQAVADPTGQTGAWGNMANGTPLSLATAVPNIQATSGVVASTTAIGADIETDDQLRTRMLQAYQAPMQIGSGSQYVTWALGVPGVTRAWASPKGFGAGTVVVYVMLDVSEAAYNGFPQGTNGVATADSPRGLVATGDQLAIANAIYPSQPGTALVYVVSPTAYAVDFTIQGLSGSASQQSAVSAAISALFLRNGAPGGTIDLRDVEAAINAISGLPPWIIQSPTANIVCPTGALPVLGTPSWT